MKREAILLVNFTIYVTPKEHHIIPNSNNKQSNKGNIDKNRPSISQNPIKNEKPEEISKEISTKLLTNLIETNFTLEESIENSRDNPLLDKSDKEIITLNLPSINPKNLGTIAFDVVLNVLKYRNIPIDIKQIVNPNSQERPQFETDFINSIKHLIKHSDMDRYLVNIIVNTITPALEPSENNIIINHGVLVNFTINFLPILKISDVVAQEMLSTLISQNGFKVGPLVPGNNNEFAIFYINQIPNSILAKKICNTPPNLHKCHDDNKNSSSLQFWYFDRQTSQCKFIDIHDNVRKNTNTECDEINTLMVNRFDTLEKCQKVCMQYIPRCELPLDTGECSEAITRFYFNLNDQSCRTFTYTGCGGNLNNFLNWNDCQKSCNIHSVLPNIFTTISSLQKTTALKSSPTPSTVTTPQIIELQEKPLFIGPPQPSVVDKTTKSEETESKERAKETYPTNQIFAKSSSWVQLSQSQQTTNNDGKQEELENKEPYPKYYEPSPKISITEAHIKHIKPFLTSSALDGFLNEDIEENFVESSETADGEKTGGKRLKDKQITPPFTFSTSINQGEYPPHDFKSDHVPFIMAHGGVDSWLDDIFLSPNSNVETTPVTEQSNRKENSNVKPIRTSKTDDGIALETTKINTGNEKKVISFKQTSDRIGQAFIEPYDNLEDKIITLHQSNSMYHSTTNNLTANLKVGSYFRDELVSADHPDKNRVLTKKVPKNKIITAFQTSDELQNFKHPSNSHNNNKEIVIKIATAELNVPPEQGTKIVKFNPGKSNRFPFATKNSFFKEERLDLDCSTIDVNIADCEQIYACFPHHVYVEKCKCQPSLDDNIQKTGKNVWNCKAQSQYVMYKPANSEPKPKTTSTSSPLKTSQVSTSKILTPSLVDNKSRKESSHKKSKTIKQEPTPNKPVKNQFSIPDAKTVNNYTAKARMNLIETESLDTSVSPLLNILQQYSNRINQVKSYQTYAIYGQAEKGKTLSLIDKRDCPKKFVITPDDIEHSDGQLDIDFENTVKKRLKASSYANYIIRMEPETGKSASFGFGKSVVPKLSICMNDHFLGNLENLTQILEESPTLQNNSPKRKKDIKQHMTFDQQLNLNNPVVRWLLTTQSNNAKENNETLTQFTQEFAERLKSMLVNQHQNSPLIHNVSVRLIITKTENPDETLYYPQATSPITLRTRLTFEYPIDLGKTNATLLKTSRIQELIEALTHTLPYELLKTPTSIKPENTLLTSTTLSPNSFQSTTIDHSIKTTEEKREDKFDNENVRIITPASHFNYNELVARKQPDTNDGLIQSFVFETYFKKHALSLLQAQGMSVEEITQNLTNLITYEINHIITALDLNEYLINLMVEPMGPDLQTQYYYPLRKDDIKKDYSSSSEELQKLIWPAFNAESFIFAPFRVQITWDKALVQDNEGVYSYSGSFDVIISQKDEKVLCGVRNQINEYLKEHNYVPILSSTALVIPAKPIGSLNYQVVLKLGYDGPLSEPYTGAKMVKLNPQSTDFKLIQRQLDEGLYQLYYPEQMDVDGVSNHFAKKDFCFVRTKNQDQATSIDDNYESKAIIPTIKYSPYLGNRLNSVGIINDHFNDKNDNNKYELVLNVSLFMNVTSSFAINALVADLHQRTHDQGFNGYLGDTNLRILKLLTNFTTTNENENKPQNVFETGNNDPLTKIENQNSQQYNVYNAYFKNLDQNFEYPAPTTTTLANTGGDLILRQSLEIPVYSLANRLVTYTRSLNDPKRPEYQTLNRNVKHYLNDIFRASPLKQIYRGVEVDRVTPNFALRRGVVIKYTVLLDRPHDYPLETTQGDDNNTNNNEQNHAKTEKNRNHLQSVLRELTQQIIDDQFLSVNPEPESGNIINENNGIECTKNGKICRFYQQKHPQSQIGDQKLHTKTNLENNVPKPNLKKQINDNYLNESSSTTDIFHTNIKQPAAQDDITQSHTVANEHPIHLNITLFKMGSTNVPLYWDHEYNNVNGFLSRIVIDATHKWLDKIFREAPELQSTYTGLEINQLSPYRDEVSEQTYINFHVTVYTIGLQNKELMQEHYHQQEQHKGADNINNSYGEVLPHTVQQDLLKVLYNIVYRNVVENQPTAFASNYYYQNDHLIATQTQQPVISITRTNDYQYFETTQDPPWHPAPQYIWNEQGNNISFSIQNRMKIDVNPMATPEKVLPIHIQSLSRSTTTSFDLNTNSIGGDTNNRDSKNVVADGPGKRLFHYFITKHPISEQYHIITSDPYFNATTTLMNSGEGDTSSQDRLDDNKEIENYQNSQVLEPITPPTASDILHSTSHAFVLSRPLNKPKSPGAVVYHHTDGDLQEYLIMLNILRRGNEPLTFNPHFIDPQSPSYTYVVSVAKKAMENIIEESSLSGYFVSAKVNSILDPTPATLSGNHLPPQNGGSAGGIMVNFTLTLTNDYEGTQEHIFDIISQHIIKSKYRISTTDLYVDPVPTSIGSLSEGNVEYELEFSFEEMDPAHYNEKIINNNNNNNPKNKSNHLSNILDDSEFLQRLKAGVTTIIQKSTLAAYFVDAHVKQIRYNNLTGNVMFALDIFLKPEYDGDKNELYTSIYGAFELSPIKLDPNLWLRLIRYKLPFEIGIPVMSENGHDISFNTALSMASQPQTPEFQALKDRFLRGINYMIPRTNMGQKISYIEFANMSPMHSITPLSPQARQKHYAMGNGPNLPLKADTEENISNPGIMMYFKNTLRPNEHCSMTCQSAYKDELLQLIRQNNNEIGKSGLYTVRKKAEHKQQTITSPGNSKTQSKSKSHQYQSGEEGKNIERQDVDIIVNNEAQQARNLKITTTPKNLEKLAANDKKGRTKEKISPPQKSSIPLCSDDKTSQTGCPSNQYCEISRRYNTATCKCYPGYTKAPGGICTSAILIPISEVSTHPSVNNSQIYANTNQPREKIKQSEISAKTSISNFATNNRLSVRGNNLLCKERTDTRNGCGLGANCVKLNGQPQNNSYNCLCPPLHIKDTNKDCKRVGEKSTKHAIIRTELPEIKRPYITEHTQSFNTKHPTYIPTTNADKNAIPKFTQKLGNINLHDERQSKNNLLLVNTFTRYTKASGETASYTQSPLNTYRVITPRFLSHPQSQRTKESTLLNEAITNSGVANPSTHQSLRNADNRDLVPKNYLLFDKPQQRSKWYQTTSTSKPQSKIQDEYQNEEENIGANSHLDFSSNTNEMNPVENGQNLKDFTISDNPTNEPNKAETTYDEDGGGVQVLDDIAKTITYRLTHMANISEMTDFDSSNINPINTEKSDDLYRNSITPAQSDNVVQESSAIKAIKRFRLVSSDKKQSKSNPKTSVTLSGKRYVTLKIATPISVISTGKSSTRTPLYYSENPLSTTKRLNASTMVNIRRTSHHCNEEYSSSSGCPSPKICTLEQGRYQCVCPRGYKTIQYAADPNAPQAITLCVLATSSTDIPPYYETTKFKDPKQSFDEFKTLSSFEKSSYPTTNTPDRSLDNYDDLELESEPKQEGTDTIHNLRHTNVYYTSTNVPPWTNLVPLIEKGNQESKAKFEDVCNPETNEEIGCDERTENCITDTKSRKRVCVCKKNFIRIYPNRQCVGFKEALIFLEILSYNGKPLTFSSKIRHLSRTLHEKAEKGLNELIIDAKNNQTTPIPHFLGTRLNNIYQIYLDHGNEITHENNDIPGKSSKTPYQDSKIILERPKIRTIFNYSLLFGKETERDDIITETEHKKLRTYIAQLIRQNNGTLTGSLAANEYEYGEKQSEIIVNADSLTDKNIKLYEIYLHVITQNGKPIKYQKSYGDPNSWQFKLLARDAEHSIKMALDSNSGDRTDFSTLKQFLSELSLARIYKAEIFFTKPFSHNNNIDDDMGLIFKFILKVSDVFPGNAKNISSIFADIILQNEYRLGRDSGLRINPVSVEIPKMASLQYLIRIEDSMENVRKLKDRNPHNFEEGLENAVTRILADTPLNGVYFGSHVNWINHTDYSKRLNVDDHLLSLQQNAIMNLTIYVPEKTLLSPNVTTLFTPDSIERSLHKALNKQNYRIGGLYVSRRQPFVNVHNYSPRTEIPIKMTTDSTLSTRRNILLKHFKSHPTKAIINTTKASWSTKVPPSYIRRGDNDENYSRSQDIIETTTVNFVHTKSPKNAKTIVIAPRIIKSTTSNTISDLININKNGTTSVKPPIIAAVPNGIATEFKAQKDSGNSLQDLCRLFRCGFGKVCQINEHNIPVCVCKPGFSQRENNPSGPCFHSRRFDVLVRILRENNTVLTYANMVNDSSLKHQAMMKEAKRSLERVISNTTIYPWFIQAPFKGLLSSNDFVDIFEDTNGHSIPILHYFLDIDAAYNGSMKDIQVEILKALAQNNNSLPWTSLYVDPIPLIRDIDECASPELNDCHQLATCINTPGAFKCECLEGYIDNSVDGSVYSGRVCTAPVSDCSDEHCNYHGECHIDRVRNERICECEPWWVGRQCQHSGKLIAILGGLALALALLVCLCFPIWLCFARGRYRRQRTRENLKWAFEQQGDHTNNRGGKFTNYGKKKKFASRTNASGGTTTMLDNTNSGDSSIVTSSETGGGDRTGNKKDAQYKNRRRGNINTYLSGDEGGLSSPSDKFNTDSSGARIIPSIVIPRARLHEAIRSQITAKFLSEDNFDDILPTKNNNNVNNLGVHFSEELTPQQENGNKNLDFECGNGLTNMGFVPHWDMNDVAYAPHKIPRPLVNNAQANSSHTEKGRSLLQNGTSDNDNCSDRSDTHLIDQGSLKGFPKSPLLETNIKVRSRDLYKQLEHKSDAKSGLNYDAYLYLNRNNNNNNNKDLVNKQINISIEDSESSSDGVIIKPNALLKSGHKNTPSSLHYHQTANDSSTTVTSNTQNVKNNFCNDDNCKTEITEEETITTTVEEWTKRYKKSAGPPPPISSVNGGGTSKNPGSVHTNMVDIHTDMSPLFLAKSNCNINNKNPFITTNLHLEEMDREEENLHFFDMASEVKNHHCTNSSQNTTTTAANNTSNKAFAPKLPNINRRSASTVGSVLKHPSSKTADPRPEMKTALDKNFATDTELQQKPNRYVKYNPIGSTHYYPSTNITINTGPAYQKIQKQLQTQNQNINLHNTNLIRKESLTNPSFNLKTKPVKLLSSSLSDNLSNSNATTSSNDSASSQDSSFMSDYDDKNPTNLNTRNTNNCNVIKKKFNFRTTTKKHEIAKNEAWPTTTQMEQSPKENGGGKSGLKKGLSRLSSSSFSELINPFAFSNPFDRKSETTTANKKVEKIVNETQSRPLSHTSSNSEPRINDEKHYYFERKGDSTGENILIQQENYHCATSNSNNNNGLQEYYDENETNKKQYGGPTVPFGNRMSSRIAAEASHVCKAWQRSGRFQNNPSTTKTNETQLEKPYNLVFNDGDNQNVLSPLDGKNKNLCMPSNNNLDNINHFLNQQQRRNVGQVSTQNGEQPNKMGPAGGDTWSSRKDSLYPEEVASYSEAEGTIRERKYVSHESQYNIFEQTTE